MGHRPMDIEQTPSQTLSRPAELVQRAKQLAQLTNFQFGRGTVAMTTETSGSTMTIEDHDDDMIPSNGNGNGNGHIPRIEPAAPQMTMKTTAQKIEDFYGVK